MDDLPKMQQRKMEQGLNQNPEEPHCVVSSRLRIILNDARLEQANKSVPSRDDVDEPLPSSAPSSPIVLEDNGQRWHM